MVSISILKGVECCWVLFNSTYFVWDASSRPTNLCTLMCFIPNNNWVLLFWDIIHFRVQFVLPAPFKSRQLNILCLQFSYLRNFISGFIELNSSANYLPDMWFSVFSEIICSSLNRWTNRVRELETLWKRDFVFNLTRIYSTVFPNDLVPWKMVRILTLRTFKIEPF